MQYVDLILFEERTIINVNPTYPFLCSIFPRVNFMMYILSDLCYCSFRCLVFVFYVSITHSLFNQISSRVAHEQWNSLVNTLVTSVIADQSQADALKDSELNDLARRLTAVRYQFLLLSSKTMSTQNDD